MKVTLYIGQSLDGYIADVDGAIDWMNTDGSADDILFKHYETFFKDIDILVMGATTYNQLVNELTKEWPYPNHLTYVITNEKLNDLPNVKFTSNVEETLINGKNIWLVGGAQIAHYFMEHDYIDEYIITTVPVCIGNGIKLFNNIKIEHLEIKKIEQLKNYVAVTYRKEKGRN